MQFHQLGLAPSLLEAVTAAGYATPTPIQARAIPAVLNGEDVLAAAQTGTGKTAAFTLPLLDRLGAEHRKTPRVLVLAPTRELAAQVNESVRAYGRTGTLRSSVIFGGVGYQPQIAALKKGVDIVVATPGRLIDHLDNGHADLSGVETLVLDEADRMLDMGFIHAIKRILKRLPGKRQNLLFSATFSKDIRRLAADLLNRPTEIDVAPRNATAESIDQKAVLVEKPRKHALLSHLITSGDWSQVLVFTRTKHGANRLVKQLDGDGLAAAALHGNKSQNARTKALEGFKAGRIRVLVATDIAARGLDINALPQVVNYELPNVAEDYVHRIGRTGRAGLGGQAVSLVGPDERRFLKDIEKLVGHPIERMQPAGIDLRAPGPKAQDNGNGKDRGSGDRGGDRPPKRAGGGRSGGKGRDHGLKHGAGGNGDVPAPSNAKRRRKPRRGKRDGQRSGGGAG